MSVRRLAEPALQPATFAFSRANMAWVKETIRKYPKGRQQSAVIPLLMRAQEQEGWVTRAAIEHVAEMLDMPQIRVLEVATFYTQYQLKPVGTKAHIQVCGTTPCMLRGAGELIDVCRSKIHPEPLQPNETGTLSWEEVECQGACVNAPMVMVFKDTYEDLTPERLAEIIDEFEAGRGAQVPVGPQNGRTYSAPLTGLTTLTDETVVLKETRDGAARDERGTAETGEGAPSHAAKPKTDAIETSPAIRSPSKVKVSPAAEKAESAPSPKIRASAADRAEPAVEGTARRRARPADQEGDKALESPELQRGEALGPDGKRRKGEAAAPKGAPSAATDRAAKPREATQDAPSAAPDSKDRPAAIARPATPDDLQLIAGIGPKNERLLHELGVYTFAQVAAWKDAERDWVDAYLRFKGRIGREEWVRQADALARGGEAEYIRVFGKKPR